MIDIHAHILPGRDDGPIDEAEAIRMASLASASGTRYIVATPHCYNGIHHSTREEILDGCRRLNRLCMSQGIRLLILPGAENRLIPELLTLYDQGRLMTLNDAGTHLLLELPDFFVQTAVRDMIVRFRERGVTVIIAHPERHPCFMDHPESVVSLMNAGARLQITAESLTGRFGKRVLKIARRMVDQGWVDWVASDGHGHTDRQPVIAPVRNVLERFAGQKAAHRILFINPVHLLNGETTVQEDWNAEMFRPTGSGDGRRK